ncbi:FAD binding domain-containing protein [Roseateles toxinivorans]|uniref:Carbon-monoxide dehydrogenase medium subunit n=1 Tax=Roseateles toxinivorans TaxID=270368 RepID=A0A4R6QPH5_9BURK|nr:xanthine dehydrogenase family protein subunit M [Roseateles toxinivorans]TDP72557.1 carbon-monoxide dehydrogenase medium subunit [Roseateles toxinivorans]
MQDFDYCRPTNVAEVLALLRDGVDSKLLAGGQSLLASMKLGLMAPARLIALDRIPALRSSSEEQGRLCLGAMQTHGELAASPALQAWVPGLAQMAGHIADAQVRAMGTVGGSLANADPAACWPAGVLALGATLITDRREIAADDFFTGLFGTALEPDELLCGIRLRQPRRMAYLKFEQPASRFALVGVAVAQFDDGVRVALTGTSQGAIRLPAFEQALSRRFDPAVLQGLRVDENIMSADLHAGADYRAHLAVVLASRVVQQALEASE